MASFNPITTVSLRTATSESARPLLSDYFNQSVCSNERADAAYQKYLKQSPERGLGFGHWLEAEARHLKSSRS